MFGRRLFHFLFTLIILAGYVLVYLYLMPMDEMQYISLLFTTIALTLLYSVPIVYPKRGKGYGKMTLRLYGVTSIYAILTVVVSYLFSFRYTLDKTISVFGLPLDEKFYFLANTVVLGIFLLIILLCMGTPHEEKEKEKRNGKEPFYDDEPVEVPAKEKPAEEEKNEPAFRFLQREEPKNDTEDPQD